MSRHVTQAMDRFAPFAHTPYPVTQFTPLIFQRALTQTTCACIKPYLELHQRFGVLNSLRIDERFERPSMKDTTKPLQIWQGRALVDLITMEVLLGKARDRSHVSENDVGEMTKGLMVWEFDSDSFVKDVDICPQLDKKYFEKIEDTISGKYVEKDHKKGLEHTLQKGREIMKEAGRGPILD